MINIKPGEQFKRFVITFLRELDFDEEEALDDLVAHANAYVNGPWSEAQKSIIEPTEQERWESYKRYIAWRLSTSTAGRIKEQLAQERKAA